MLILGQAALLAALVSFGYAAFGIVASWYSGHGGLHRTALWAWRLGLTGLSLVLGVLAWALLAKDFRFAYVAQYSSRLLPWYYSLSALWVGQAGSLLLWTWMVAGVACVFRRTSKGLPEPVRAVACGVLLGVVAFLMAVMVFGADPVAPSLSPPADGAGLGPVLQHPAMLAHPPAVFLGYALWTIPFALACAAAITGQLQGDWLAVCRRWALAAWSVQGIGILIGAEWAYEELGWGGYWAWDPVENGSLLPWLTGTAMIHTALAWSYRGVLKKTTVLLAVATFGLCNFAAFLTRSGIFGSLHEFSRSTIAWMFLLLLAVLAAAGPLLVCYRRGALRPQHALGGLWSREGLAALAAAALVLLAAIVTAGTLAGPVSKAIAGRAVTLEPHFYNTAAAPLALVLLGAMAMVPLVRWGGPPQRAERQKLAGVVALAVVGALVAFIVGVRHGVALAVVGLSVLALGSLLAAAVGDFRSVLRASGWRRRARLLLARRRQYAGYVMHLGFVSLMVGVAGSSLGSATCDVTLLRGQAFEWLGYTIRLASVEQTVLADKRVVETRLEVEPSRGAPFLLVPAQHFHFTTQEWTAEVAVRSTWWGDLYAVAHGGSGDQRADLTFIVNPLMRFIWLSGGLVAVGAVAGLWPRRRAKGGRPPGTAAGLQPELDRFIQARGLRGPRRAPERTTGVSPAASCGPALNAPHRNPAAPRSRDAAARP